jgi:hypothetical protein
VEDEEMNAKRLLGALLCAGLSLGVASQAADVHAQGKKKADAPAADPPVTKKAITLTLSGVSWGMSPKQLGDTIDKILDDDYRPLYKAAQPGVAMKELDAQIAEDKASFRRSRIDFGKLPTGLDAGPLRGEYTYNNGEALYSFDRKGERAYFFFIKERLWKIIEEHKLNDASPLGKTYPDVVVKLSASFGVPGRVQAADGVTRNATEVDWKDATTHLRIIQRSDTAAAFAFEDNGTLANLASLRTNKPVDDNGIDPDVAAAVHGPTADPGPPTKDPKKKK